VPPEVVSTVVQAYYNRGVTAADLARNQAQQGYTIATAVAAGLVAAGALTNFSSHSDWVLWLGLISLALWFIVALCFVWVVAWPAAVGRDPDWHTEYEFVEGVATTVQEELNNLRQRLGIAIACTCLATLVTLFALGATAFDVGGTSTQKVSLAVTAKEDAALKSMCGRNLSDIDGTVDPNSLESDDLIVVTLPPGECGTQLTKVTIPKSEIVADRRSRYSRASHGDDPAPIA
jgi:hypothetical protein